MGKNISIYPSDALDRACALNGGGRNRSHRISQIADRYGEIMRRADLPALSGAEMAAIRDACNGTLHEPASLIPGALAQGVGYLAASEGLAEKWGIDGEALVAKLVALTYPQEVRLIEDVERFWAEQTNARPA